jgi:CubicO group peptidase (beta-lactamase class C family)
VPIFSGTKGLVATCVLMLPGRGQVELKAPLARYRPEFAANDKGAVTVEDALSHRAGVPGITTPILAPQRDPVDQRHRVGVVAGAVLGLALHRWLHAGRLAVESI